MAALWTGLGPNIARNAIINAAELASYDHVKEVSHILFLICMKFCLLSLKCCFHVILPLF